MKTGLREGLRRSGARFAVVALFLVLLAPALASLTSPAWCPPLCRWAAGRLGADLRLADARFDPFGLKLRGGTGSLRVATPAGTFTGGINRLLVDIDLVPLAAGGRIGSVSVAFGTLRVEPARGRRGGVVAGPDGARTSPETPRSQEVQSAAGVSEGRAGLRLVIDRLDVAVERGVFGYDRGDATGEVAFDLGFRGSYRNVRGLDDLAAALVRDAVRRKAVDGILERWLR